MREEAILEAAHRLLAEKGFQGMTMDELAARLGIAKGSLYQHFRSKEELLGVALVSFMDRISEYVDSLSSAQPAIERLKQTYRSAAPAIPGRISGHLQCQIPYRGDHTKRKVFRFLS